MVVTHKKQKCNSNSIKPTINNLIKTIQNAINSTNKQTKIQVVNKIEQPFSSSQTDNTIERRFYIAPQETTFQTLKLDKIIEKLEKKLKQYDLSPAYFNYYDQYLTEGMIYIGKLEEKFRFNLNTVTQLETESHPSINKLYIYPCIEIAQIAYQLYNTQQKELFKIPFSMLEKYGFNPQKHLTKKELEEQYSIKQKSSMIQLFPNSTNS